MLFLTVRERRVVYLNGLILAQAAESRGFQAGLFDDARCHAGPPQLTVPITGEAALSAEFDITSYPRGNPQPSPLLARRYRPCLVRADAGPELDWSSCTPPPNWGTGGQIGRLLVQHAAFLSLETLKDALIEWYDNDQCRLASAMPGLAVQLVLATAHLGVARGPLFADFAAKCEASAGEGDYYSYPEVKATLDKVGLN